MGGSTTSGYSEGGTPSTYTQINSLSFRPDDVILAENSCVRLYDAGTGGQGEKADRRIGNLTFQRYVILIA